MVLDVRPDEGGRKMLAALRRQLDTAVIALDYDGTLAPIVTDPAEAVPAPGAVDALIELSRKALALVLITGRPAQQVVEIGGLEKIPGFVVLGMYGAERWSA